MQYISQFCHALEKLNVSNTSIGDEEVCDSCGLRRRKQPLTDRFWASLLMHACAALVSAPLARSTRANSTSTPRAPQATSTACKQPLLPATRAKTRANGQQWCPFCSRAPATRTTSALRTDFTLAAFQPVQISFYLLSSVSESLFLRLSVGHGHSRKVREVERAAYSRLQPPN